MKRGRMPRSSPAGGTPRTGVRVYPASSTYPNSEAGERIQPSSDAVAEGVHRILPGTACAGGACREPGAPERASTRCGTIRGPACLQLCDHPGYRGDRWPAAAARRPDVPHRRGRPRHRLPASPTGPGPGTGTTAARDSPGRNASGTRRARIPAARPRCGRRPSPAPYAAGPQHPSRRCPLPAAARPRRDSRRGRACQAVNRS
jgi:hypothetical protein